MIDKDKFLAAYQGHFGELKPSPKVGLSFLIDAFNADKDMTDPRHIAYCLATVRHECARTWQPIEEYRKGKGYKYGHPNVETGKAYYGRGYVQLTWDYNYISLGRALNVDLFHKPELALDPQIAYEIMSLGMRRGSFTGKRLRDYINADGCNYVGARRIINGLDCADKIAGYAETLEGIIRGSFSPSVA
jgi:putative chitinase